MEKIIAAKNYRGYQLVKASIDLEDSLNMKFFVSEKDDNSDLDHIEKAVERFNSIEWTVKRGALFTHIEGENYTEEQIEVATNKIEEFFSSEEKDIPYTEKSINDISWDSFNSSGDTAKVIGQLSFFNNMPIPQKTVTFLQDYVDRIEEINFTKQQLRSIYSQFADDIRPATEYVMYIGPNEKFKGCVGKIIQHRDDVAPHLIEFKNFKGSGSSAKFWSRQENIIKFNI